MSVFFIDFDMAPSVIWARDLYDQMQIQSDFRKWFPRMCQYGFVEGRDYEFVPRVRPQDEGGRTVQRYVKDYRITLEMAKQLYKLHHFHKNGCFHSCEGQHCMGTDHWMQAIIELLHQHKCKSHAPPKCFYESQPPDSLVTTTQIAKEYGCGAKVFNRLLHLHGIQYRANNQWVLYNPLGMKSDFILSLCELIMGARDGMEPEEKSVIDRCLPLVYQKYLNDPKPENMPILGDLYDCLREQKERQAQRIATALEIYVNGSLRVFNHQTNVELDNRLICFDIKELGKQLKKLGMLIVQDQVWNRVTINRNAKKNTRYYIDEFHLLLKEEQTAAYSVEIWKRFRKWGGIPTGITQNIKDLLASREIENIFENSDFIYMLNQASGDRQILAKQLNISPFQLSYVTNSNEGEGLLFYGNTIIPFKDKFDTSLKLYGLMTTKPNEIAKYREKKDA